MHFYVGTAIRVYSEHKVWVTGCTWYREITPTFNTKNMSIKTIKQNLCAVALIKHTNVATAINALGYRVIEKLIINRVIDANPAKHTTPFKLSLMLPNGFRKLPYTWHISDQNIKWVQTASNTLLNAYERGNP